MRKALVLAAVLAAAGPSRADFIDFKSPGPGMRFTAGFPVRVLADVIDVDLWAAADRGLPQAECYWDGVQMGARQSGSNTDINDFDFSVPAGLVTAGTHELKIKGFFMSGGSLEKSMSVVVEPLPAKTVVSLAANVSGSVHWDNVIVRGNGFSVNGSGSLVIRNSLVTGLGGIGGSYGSVDVQGSIFEDTGPLDVSVSGGATIKGNEFRANNRLTFVPNNPSTPVMIRLRGAGTSPKVFQGNRLAAGQIEISGMSDWLIGGDTDAETNILMGPRCVLNLVNSSRSVVRGNYSRHNYRGLWSQGFNFVFSGSVSAGADKVVVEHNLIRGGSWPVQTLAGEFRYNVVVGYGHNWLRSARTGASIHHNLFTPSPEEPTGANQDAGFFFYGDETVSIHNNTFDGGGTATGNSPFVEPFLRLKNGSAGVSSLRNNLFAFQRNGRPAVWGESGAAPVGYADYNAFYSPDNATQDNYASVNVPGRTEGSGGVAGPPRHRVNRARPPLPPAGAPQGRPGGWAGSAGHDVNGVNGELASFPFAGTRILPYEAVVDEAAVWQGTQKLSSVLAAYRARYAPAAGGPLIDAGDPADGAGIDIGAIGGGQAHPADRLGTFGSPSAADVLSPARPRGIRKR